MVPMNWTLMPICSSFLESFGRIVACPENNNTFALVTKSGTIASQPLLECQTRTSYTLPVHVQGRLLAPVLVGLDVDHLSRIGVIKDNVDVYRGREEVGHLRDYVKNRIGARLVQQRQSQIQACC
jgi:hypothetical protein